ncbi:2OG-Fe(II) oxygenase [Gonapodya prolifera JEL478]|uniref:2OG-Fe(II) oxygenase n=1 Tax=Gonapodya prolifera (strain JEL478) TaxID=1344416 RepID=A0A139A8F6_GONPJ|nr:2OG-Fe(II) oxygenase [Gonapodya prolifera JEL478]|eukprot:KXS13082.1 2OG-Fe(II) oxygenase [Gonapodya prolifera JEL478]
MNVSTGLGDRHVTVDSGLDAARVDFTSIPVVDLAPIFSDDDAAKQKLGEELKDICTNVGFLYVKNHQVPDAVIDAVFAEAHAFFALPDATKMQYHIQNSKSLRGYGKLLDENVDPANRGDLHESFDIGLEIAEDDPDYLAGKFYGPNQWPDASHMPTFRANLVRYYTHMQTLSKYLFRAFSLALGMPETYFDGIDKGKAMGFMRILHYPPQEDAVDEKQMGIGAHTDYILKQDDKEALQVLNSKGQWIHAPPIPGTFVVNIADLLSRWSNDKFKSTMHRAINRTGVARYSIPFFYNVHHDTPVEVLPACLAPGEKPKYPPTTAGAYLTSRFEDTFAVYKQQKTEASL